MQKFAGVVLFVALSVGLAVAQSSNSATSPMPPVPKVAALPPAAEQAMASIDPENIRAHVKFLAHDLLEGRGTGQRGGDIAAEYIATQFELYGLKPAGDNGSYMQKVPMVGIITLPDSTYSLIPAEGDAHGPAQLKTTSSPWTKPARPRPTIDAPVVFVGYGIDAPEFKWNDYKDVDVRGKVLLMLVNEPPSDDPKFFSGKALTYYGRWTYKYEEAARRARPASFSSTRPTWPATAGTWCATPGPASVPTCAPTAPKLKLASWVQLEIARKLLRIPARTWTQLIAAGASARLQAHPAAGERSGRTSVSKVRPFDSNNVVAMLPGSDPKLKDQAVLYSAHYDHLGIHPGSPATTSTTARGQCHRLRHPAGDGTRLSASPRRRPSAPCTLSPSPPRSRDCAAPSTSASIRPCPRNMLSLDLNFDDVPPLGIPEEIDVSGAERTTFYPTVESTAKAFGLAIVPDSNPGAGHYYRSDHFSLARVGVPAFSMGSGELYQGHDKEWGMQKMRDYRRQRLPPSQRRVPSGDGFRQRRRHGAFRCGLGWQAANQATEVGWKQGDEFEKARKASGAQ